MIKRLKITTKDLRSFYIDADTHALLEIKRSLKSGSSIRVNSMGREEIIHNENIETIEYQYYEEVLT